jgi:hypothetical protein
MPLTQEINTKWNDAYIRAALEVDVHKMPDRIFAARDAVAGRLKDLEGDSDHHAERHEIETALAALGGLELETRVWPTVGEA